MSDELEHFLSEQSAQGGSDSSGFFTLSPERALDKIRDFQFAGPLDWVLALVQGCHAMPEPRPAKLEFKYNRACTTLVISSLEAAIIPKLQVAASDLHDLEPWMAPFRRALWALMNQAVLEIRHRGVKLKWDGHQFVERRARYSPNLEWTVFYREDKSVNRARGAVDLRCLLWDRCWRTQIPLTYDTIPVPHHPPVRGRSAFSPLVLARGEYGTATGKLFTNHWDESKLSRHHPLFYFFHERKSLMVGFYCSLHYSEDSPSTGFQVQPSASETVLVKHGVVVERRTFGTAPIFAVAVVEDDELPTDFTGLAARREAGEERLDFALVRKLWRDVSGALETNEYLFETLGRFQESREVMGPGWALMGASLAVGASLVFPKLLFATPFVAALVGLRNASPGGSYSNLGKVLKQAIKETSLE